MLGLASGGAYLDWRTRLADGIALHLGVTQRRDARDTTLFGMPNPASGARVYAATAEHLGIDYTVSEALVVRTSVTRLHEPSGLLGVQSLDANQLVAGSTTTGATLGFDWSLGRGFTLSGSGTLAKTVTGADQALRTSPGGLGSSAAELALSRSGLFSKDDRLRLAVAKSMQVESGTLHLTSYGVVDRQTGGLGVFDQTANPAGGPTPWSAEVMYGRLLAKRSAEASGFVRAESGSADSAAGAVNYVVGGRYRIAF